MTLIDPMVDVWNHRVSSLVGSVEDSIRGSIGECVVNASVWDMRVFVLGVMVSPVWSVVSSTKDYARGLR